MTEDHFELELRQKSTALERLREPDRDLWPGIELTLDKKRTPHKKYLVTVAAACIFLISCGFFAWQHVNQQRESTLLASLQENHYKQMNQLYISFEDQQALSRNWQEQLEELDQAAKQILAALKDDPENMALLQMLKSIYQQKLLLVERVHEPRWQHIYTMKNEVAL